jgi:hypothetical protein
MAGEVAMNSGKPCALSNRFSAASLSARCNARRSSTKHGNQALVFPRLLNEVASASTHGFNRQLNISPSRHHNDRQRTILRNDLRKQVQALATGRGVARVVEINEDGIILFGGQSFPSKLRRADAVNPVSFRL